MNTEISTNMPIDTASVKVMRSHDCCHFEVCLSTTLRNQIDAAGQVDELRKTAARLADKAVDQYKAAKENAELAMSDKQGLETMRYRARQAMEKPEAERTPEDMAMIKAIEDRAHRNRPRYNYDDDWQEPDWDDDEEGEMF